MPPVYTPLLVLVVFSLNIIPNQARLSLVLARPDQLEPPSKRAAHPDAEPVAGMPDGLDLSVSLPFDVLRRRYLQAITRGHNKQVGGTKELNEILL